jgi:predicted phage-related endonuclease
VSFTVIDAPQRSEAWFKARAGRITGSVAKEMLAKLKDGKPAAGRKNLCLRLMLERVTGKPQESEFVSAAMQVGIEREEFAFAAYEALTGDVVARSGFLSHDTLMAGCSLDGHLGNFDKLLSIKCRQPAAHLDFIRSQKVPMDALTQIRHELWLTGAQAHDYFSWNPDFPEDLQSRVITVTRAQAEIPEYEAEVVNFLAEVDTEVNALNTIRKGWAA